MERTRKRQRSASVNARRKKRPTIPGHDCAVNSDSMDLMYEDMKDDLVGVVNGDKLVLEELEKEKQAKEERRKEEEAKKEKAHELFASELSKIRAEQEDVKQSLETSSAEM